MSPHELIWIFLLASAAVRTSSIQQYEFVDTPGLVRADVNQSAALEWMLNMEPKNYHFSALYSLYKKKPVFAYDTLSNIMHNPSEYTLDPRASVYETSSKGTGFRLEGLRLEDAGNYTCWVQGLNVSDSATGYADLFIYDIPSKPTLRVALENIIMNTTLYMDCQSTSMSLPVAYRPAMLYTWNRNGDVIDMVSPPERHTVTGDMGEQLEIYPVHYTDHQATYTCTASENGTNLSSPVADDVKIKVSYGPVTLVTDPRNPRVVENSTLVITATADCNPNCSFTWRNGSDVISDSAVLEFDRIQPDEAGIYTVRAYNDYWDLTLHVQLTVVPKEVPGDFSTSARPATTYGDIPGSSVSPDDDLGDGNMTIIIAVSVIAGLVVIVIVVVVVVMVIRRNERKNTGSERTGDGTTVSVSANNNAPQVTNHFHGPNGAMAAPDVVESVLYDQVGKKKWKKTSKGNDKEETTVVSPPPPIYAQVNQPRKRNGDKTKVPEDASDDAALTAIYAQVNKRNKKGISDGTTPDDKTVSPEVPPPPAVYAQVMKKKKKGLLEEEEGTTETEAGTANSAFSSPGGDGAYDDVAARHPGVPGQEERTYYNTAPMRRVPEAPNGDPIMSPGGVTYADVGFVNDGRAESRVVHQKEAPTEYASIALTRRTSAEDS